MVGGYEYARKCPTCGGNKQQDVQERRERSGIPAQYKKGVNIESFNPNIYGEVTGRKVDISGKMEVIHSFIKDFYKWEQNGVGLYIYSKTKGTGKSYLASCIANSIIEKYALSMKYISFAELIDRAKEENGTRDLQTTQLLIIDDLGAKFGGIEWTNDILFQIVDSRINNKRATIYTSNLQAEELPVDERVADRIAASTMILELPEISVRGGTSQKKKIKFAEELGLIRREP